MKATGNLPRWMEQAIWDGDTDTLFGRARCICCCAEHTFENCPARLWNGCRGQDTPTTKDIEGWADLYGMTKAEFLAPQD